jgi:hypothetical protein
MTNQTYILFILVIVISSACKKPSTKSQTNDADTIPLIIPLEKPVDTLLTGETKALWINLKNLKGSGILFGQQDATIAGIDWKNNENRCDVEELTGAYPALYGYELSGIGNEANMDSIPFTIIRQRMIEAFDRGGEGSQT